MLDKFILLLIGVQVLFRSSFFDVNVLPSLDIAGSSSLGVHDITFFILFIAVIIKVSKGRSHAFEWNYLNKLLLIYLIVGLLSVFNAVMTGTSFHLAAREAREFFLYSAYFFVLALTPNEQNIIKLSKYLLIIAILTSVFSVLQIVIGERMSFIYGKVATLNTLDSNVEGVTRIASGGLSTINLMFFISIAILMEKLDKKYLVYFVVLSIGILVSFNRGTWLSIILAIIAIMPLLKARLQSRILKVSLVLGIIAFISFWSGSIGMLGDKVSNYTSAVIERFESLMPGHIEKDGSTRDRFTESEMVFNKYLERPLFGHGLGAITQDQVMIRGESDYATNAGAWGYVHNGYLYVLFKLGLVGFLIFMLFIILFVIRSIKTISKLENSKYKSFYLGSLLFIVSVIPHSIVSPRIMEGKYILIIALSLAYMELIRINALRSSKEINAKESKLINEMSRNTGVYSGVKLRH